MALFRANAQAAVAGVADQEIARIPLGGAIVARNGRRELLDIVHAGQNELPFEQLRFIRPLRCGARTAQIFVPTW